MIYIILLNSIIFFGYFCVTLHLQKRTLNQQKSLEMISKILKTHNIALQDEKESLERVWVKSHDMKSEINNMKEVLKKVTLK